MTRLCVSKKTHWLSLRVCRTSVPLFRGGGEDVTGGGDVHVTNLRGGSVKHVTGDACSPKLRYMFFSFFFSISHFNRENESARVGRYAISCTCSTSVAPAANLFTLSQVSSLLIPSLTFRFVKM